MSEKKGRDPSEKRDASDEATRRRPKRPRGQGHPEDPVQSGGVDPEHQVTTGDG